MEFTVDAGGIVSARAVSPRDAADLARLELGERTQFPIDVYAAGSEEPYRFELAQDAPRKPPKPARPPKRTRRKEA